MNELTARLRKIPEGCTTNPEIYLGERVGVAGHTLGHVSDAWVENGWVMLKVSITEPKDKTHGGTDPKPDRMPDDDPRGGHPL
jgi:hypothetical protein